MKLILLVLPEVESIFTLSVVFVLLIGGDSSELLITEQHKIVLYLNYMCVFVCLFFLTVSLLRVEASCFSITANEALK
jgi:hypothetical protein